MDCTLSDIAAGHVSCESSASTTKYTADAVQFFQITILLNLQDYVLALRPETQLFQVLTGMAKHSPVQPSWSQGLS